MSDEVKVIVEEHPTVINVDSGTPEVVVTDLNNTSDVTVLNAQPVQAVISNAPVIDVHVGGGEISPPVTRSEVLDFVYGYLDADYFIPGVVGDLTFLNALGLRVADNAQDILTAEDHNIIVQDAIAISDYNLSLLDTEVQTLSGTISSNYYSLNQAIMDTDAVLANEIQSTVSRFSVLDTEIQTLNENVSSNYLSLSQAITDTSTDLTNEAQSTVSRLSVLDSRVSANELHYDTTVLRLDSVESLAAQNQFDISQISIDVDPALVASVDQLVIDVSDMNLRITANESDYNAAALRLTSVESLTAQNESDIFQLTYSTLPSLQQGLENATASVAADLDVVELALSATQADILTIGDEMDTVKNDLSFNYLTSLVIDQRITNAVDPAIQSIQDDLLYNYLTGPIIDQRIDTALGNLVIEDGRYDLILTQIGDLDTKYSGLVVTQDAIDLRVTNLRSDMNGEIFNLSEIIVTSEEIDLRVSQAKDYTDSKIFNLSEITLTSTEINLLVQQTENYADSGIETLKQTEIKQNADAISLETINRQTLGNDVIELKGNLTLTADSLTLLISDYNTLVGEGGRFEALEQITTATSETTTILSQDLGTVGYEISTLRTLTTNKFGVHINESTGAFAGFELLLYPEWRFDYPYTLGDFVHWIDGLNYECVSSHTSTETNQPGNTSYWSTSGGSIKSEFTIEAAKFQIITDAGPTPVFTVVGNSVGITGVLTIGPGSTGYDQLTDIPTTIQEINSSEYDELVSTVNFVNTTYPADQENLEGLIDGKIDSWFQSTDPALTWSGTDSSHEGDMWWNTATSEADPDRQTLKRYLDTGWSAPLTDQTAIDAYANAATAQDTADNKRRVFVDTPYPPYDEGDLWDRGTDLGVWRCKTPTTAGETYNVDHWQQLADTTDYTAIQTDAQDRADAAQAAAEAASDAYGSASAMYTSAQTYADTAADLAKTTAEAYADGILDDAEIVILAAAQDKADAAEIAAVITANAHSDNIVTTAEQAAIDAAQAYSDAQDSLHDTIASAYADGIVSDEEARAISDAQNKADAAEAAAKAHTEAWSDAGADKTSDVLSATSLAWDERVSLAKLDETVIIGGYLKTTLIELASLTFDKFSDLAGRVHFTDAGEITFHSSTNAIWGGSFGLSMIAGATQQINLWTNQIRITSKASSNATIELESNGYTSIGSNNSSTYLGAGQNISLQAGSSSQIQFKFSTTTKMHMVSTGLVPTSNNSISCGYTGNIWAEVHANKFVAGTGGYMDDLDDLYELSKVAPRYKKETDTKSQKEVLVEDRHPSGIRKLDVNSLPRWMTTHEESAQRLRNDCGCMITEADIIEYLEDHEEAGWMVGRDLAMFTDLTSGAVRQLDTDVLAMFELLSTRITKIEKQLLR